MTRRIFVYILGLFIMTIGIGFSIKADMGVSPVSTIPYTVTLVTGLEMGKATILFHIVLILFQILLLRKEFKMKNLTQILVAIIFGYFTTFSNYMVSLLPATENYGIRLMFLLASIVLVAIGIFLYLPADVVPLAGEGAMQAIVQKSGIAFPKVKVAFDIALVLISGISCMAFLGNLGSVGVGTVIAAILVGIIIGIIMKFFKDRLDRFLTDPPKDVAFENEL